MGNGQEAAFVMNRSSASGAGLILTSGLGPPAYENVSGTIWISLEKGMGVVVGGAAICKINDMM